MALIKSNKLIQKGTAVVAGDSIQTAEVEALIPQAPDPAPTPSADQGVIGLGIDLGQPLGLSPAGDEPFMAGEEEGDAPESPADAEALELRLPASEPTPTEPSALEDFDAERDALLQATGAETEARLGEVRAGHEATLAQAHEETQQEAWATVQDVHAPESPEAETAMQAVQGDLARAAQALARQRTIFEINQQSWQAAASAEEQIALLLDNFHARLAEDPPAEDQLMALIGEREALLSEARLNAERLVQEAQAKAAAIVLDAETKAARTILEVETRRQQILEELKQQGYSEGYQEGRGQADEEGAKIVNEAMESLDKMAGALREAVKRNEEKLLKLAIGIAEKILHDEIAVRPDTVLKTLEEALTKVSDLEEVTVKVNPEDLPMVQTQEEAFRDRLKSVRKVEFTSSPKIQRGGVLIETGSGTVDAQIKTQLSVIQEAFDFVRAEYAEEPLDMTGSSS